MAQTDIINGYQVLQHVHKKRAYMRQPAVKFSAKYEDICQFVVRGDEVAAGGRYIHVFKIFNPLSTTGLLTPYMIGSYCDMVIC